jgi:hypothetical protein
MNIHECLSSVIFVKTFGISAAKKEKPTRLQIAKGEIFYYTICKCLRTRSSIG